MAEASEADREKCIKPRVQTVAKSVKYLLNPAETVRSTAGTVSQSAKVRAGKQNLSLERNHAASVIGASHGRGSLLLLDGYLAGDSPRRD